MASKRNRPYDEPPSPESSAEEEEEVEEEEEEEDEDEEEQQTPIQTPAKQPLESDDAEDDEEQEEEEEEDDEESDDDDVKNPALTPKTPVEAKTKAVPESKSESDSETDSDTDAQRSQKAANYTIKPVSKESPSSKSKSAGAKAVAVKEKEKEKEKVVKEKDKAVKVQQKAVEEEEEAAEKKGAITRLWGFSDEIAVLQGLIDFKRENNKDPGANHDEFYNFVKVKLSNSKFTKIQVMDKVRRLKKKYRNHLSKSSSGKDPEISNPHELKSFQLSKIVWGDVDGSNIGNAHANSIVNPKSHSKANVSDNAANMVTVSSYNNNNHVKSSAKKIKLSEKVTHSEVDMMEVDEENKRGLVKDSSKEEEKFGQLYPHLMKAFEGESVPRVPLLDGLKSCLTDVDSSQLEEWDRKWKEVRLAETAAYISRLALIQEQTSWFCNAMKSSKH